MLKQLKKDLKKLADPGKAKVLQRFFKTGKGEYGEGDKFLGIILPNQRQLAKKYVNSLSFGELNILLRSKIHEERLIALLILVDLYKHGAQREQKAIYKFYLGHTKFINNWDLVDLSAPRIVGAYLRLKNKSVLVKLAKSQNLWQRRIAVLATFNFTYYGDPTWTIKLARLLLKDKEDLIHKAVGWMLREVGKRCGEKHLTDFLNKNYKIMPRTMLRYSIERLPEKLRKYYLKK